MEQYAYRLILYVSYVESVDMYNIAVFNSTYAAGYWL